MDAAVSNNGADTYQSDEVSERSIQGPELRMRLQTGRENVSKQEVVLDRLKRIRGPLGFLRDVGGAAAEVRVHQLQIGYETVAHAYMKLNPYAKLAFNAVDSLYKVYLMLP